MALCPPEAVDPNCLCGNADNEKIGGFETVVGYDAVLEGADNCDCGVEGVSEEKVADEVNQRLLQVPDLSKCSIELPKSHCEDVRSRWDLFMSIIIYFSGDIQDKNLLTSSSFLLQEPRNGQ